MRDDVNSLTSLTLLSNVVLLESHAAEKRQLVNEIVSLKKKSDLHDRDCARRDLQVHQYKNEADKGLTALQDAERKVQNYRVEVKTSNCSLTINTLQIGHFRVAFCLCFKPSPSAKPFI